MRDWLTLCRLVVLAGMLLAAGCAPRGTITGDVQHEVEQTGKAAANFDPKQVIKADIDRLADVHRRTASASLRLLAEKLYKRNPREWRKTSAVSMEAALDTLFDPRSGFRHPSLANVRGTDAIVLGLREDFAGDRVAAFICGLGGMLNEAFEQKDEFFLTDTLDPQKLYNSARNVEIAAWKLASARDAGSQLLLLSNEMAAAGQPANLSFEREFGKLVGNLDLLAIMLAERHQRTIARIVQNIATAIFLPVGALR